MIEYPNYPKPEVAVAAAALSKSERQIKMNKIVIEHERLTRAVEAIAMNHRPVIGGNPNSGKFFVIIGDTRAGKSFAIDRYVKRNPSYEVDGNTKIPVLKVAAPIGATVHTMANKILTTAGFHVNPRMNVTALMDTVIRMLPNIGCEVLVIDEFNEIANASRPQTLLNMRGYLRRLVDEAGIVAMLVGLEETYDLLADDQQIVGRGNLPVHVIPSYDMTNRRDQDDFRNLCEAFDAMLPFPKWSGLSDPTLARHLAAASNGLIGRLKDLIGMAAFRAMNDDADRIEVFHFAEAYGSTIAEQSRSTKMKHSNLNKRNIFRDML